MNSWIVEPNVLGGWDARQHPSGEPAFHCASRETAEAWARACAGATDEVIVRDGNGTVLARFTPTGIQPRSEVPAALSPPVAPVSGRPNPAPVTTPPGAPQAQTTPPSLVGRLEKEGETWDSWLDVAIPLAAALLVGGFTPAFLDLGTSWLAIFIGTLSWSAGVAGATYFLTAHKLQGMDAVGAAGLSLLVALGIAYLLGTGVLDVGSQWLEAGGNPWIRVIVAFVFAAVLAYGPLGALVSAAIGVWLGYRIAQHFPGD